ncbi:MAG: Gfo/Idh/MocA family oxidoreductase [Synechococcales cyanobacterium CRU_2_2]|nr:Gfo/Idh/MocA family oxidoreductase [Synechococcales cyanobacterium CRU_2_2]
MAFSAANPLGVAVVGTGFGQKVHLPGFQACAQTRPVAVYHRIATQAQAIAAAHHVPHACTSLSEVLALPEVEAVSIATPPFAHYPMAKAALEAGKHVLLEKPTTLNAAEAKALAELATARGLVVALDFEYRFVPAWQYLAELLQDGFVGQTYLIRIDWLMSSRADKSRPWNWYAQKEMGGGALGALGSHTFDYVNWLFGPVRRLSALLSTAIAARTDPATGKLRPVDADDTCLLTLELTDGTPVQIALSSVSRCGRGHWVEVYGDRGTLILGSSNQQDYVHGFTLRGAKAGEELVEMPIPDRLEFQTHYPDGRLAPFIRVVENWVTNIAVAAPPGVYQAPGIQEGWSSQQLMDAAHQSDRTGQWVDVG